jgi:pimeloyl-ACP methyl ester carboxylesterase
MNAALAPLETLFGPRPDESPRLPTPQRRAVLAALNGVMGDYLADSGSALALPMTFRRDGAELPTDPAALAAALPHATGRLLLLVHGLCLGDACWACAGGGLGGALARALGYTPVALSYNSGRHISSNGRDLAGRLAALVAAWPRPVEELVIVGHSMGGLVARSACHYGAAAGYEWPGRLRALITLGTPHHGAPLERGGNWLNVVLDGSPYAAPFSRLGKGRSAGITDLRYGSLVDEDWHGRDRFAPTADNRAIVPLPAGARSYAVAAVLGGPGAILENGATLGGLLGDGLVPLDSALGRHADPARALSFDDTWIGYGMGHRDLLTRPEVIEQVVRWLS